jgi:hypothetical protein
MTEAERATVKKVDKSVDDVLRLLENMDVSALPDEVREKISRLRTLTEGGQNEAP